MGSLSRKALDFLWYSMQKFPMSEDIKWQE